MRWLFILLAGVLAASCKTTSTLEAGQPASLVRLDEKFQVFARLGDLPITLNEKEAVSRYAISPRGRSPEYLIIVSPSLAKGKIEVPLKESGNTIESAVFYNSYLDRLLRVHRLILRGQIQEAKRDLEQIDRVYDRTFGSVVMSGNIAVLEKRYNDAAQHFADASSIYPQAEFLNAKAEAGK